MTTPNNNEYPNQGDNNSQYPNQGYGNQQPFPGQVPPGYEVREKKPWYKKAGCLIPLIIGIIMILIVGGCTAIMGVAVNEVDKELNAEKVVTYRIEGDAQDAWASYTTEDLNTVQDNGVAAGWEKEVTVTGVFPASLSVSNGMYDEGSITCQILVGGEVVAENTATGPSALATCSYDD